MHCLYTVASDSEQLFAKRTVCECQRAIAREASYFECCCVVYKNIISYNISYMMILKIYTILNVVLFILAHIIYQLPHIISP